MRDEVSDRKKTTDLEVFTSRVDAAQKHINIDSKTNFSWAKWLFGIPDDCFKKKSKVYII